MSGWEQSEQSAPRFSPRGRTVPEVCEPSVPGPKPNPESVGLPTRAFLYTLDQISALLDISQVTLETQHIYFDLRSMGAKTKHDMYAYNIAQPGQPPDWRVTESELIRWLKVKRIRFYLRGWAL